MVKQQTIFDFVDTAIVDVAVSKLQYKERLLEQIKRDVDTLEQNLEGPEGREFYERRIASYREEFNEQR